MKILLLISTVMVGCSSVAPLGNEKEVWFVENNGTARSKIYHCKHDDKKLGYAPQCTEAEKYQPVK